jgi:hypothetical protein
MKPIEKGIRRVPRNESKVHKYPLRQMAIDDSFAMTVEEYKSDVYCIRTFGQNHGLRFSICRHNGAYRCWRVG